MLSIITARIAVGRPPSLCTSCYMLIQSGSALEPLQPRSQVPIKVLKIGPEPFHVSPMAHASVSAWPTVGMDLSREPRGNQPPGAVTSLETDWLQSVSDWLVLWFLGSFSLELRGLFFFGLKLLGGRREHLEGSPDFGLHGSTGST